MKVIGVIKVIAGIAIGLVFFFLLYDFLPVFMFVSPLAFTIFLKKKSPIFWKAFFCTGGIMPPTIFVMAWVESRLGLNM